MLTRAPSILVQIFDFPRDPLLCMQDYERRLISSCIPGVAVRSLLGSACLSNHAKRIFLIPVALKASHKLTQSKAGERADRL